MKVSAIFILLTLSTVTYAQNSDYEYCIIWGVASAANDNFTLNLADKILDKKGISLDKVCSTLKQTSYKQGQQWSKGNTTNKDVMQSWFIYQNFRDKVMNKLIDILKL